MCLTVLNTELLSVLKVLYLYLWSLLHDLDKYFNFLKFSASSLWNEFPSRKVH